MSYLALYREWRPKTFDEVVEQKQAVYALRQAVISRQIGHAYLFSGTRGTGKTTLAKIFSRAINCLDPQAGNPCNQCEICRGVLDGSLLDVVEMDAASNNSVDNVRRITDEVNFMPARAHYKVYIIDEVHMLTTGAFNALLKTLEEPPAHAVFILATTEPHRIPATILSRCQRYDFRRIPVESITARLAEIARADNIPVDASGLETIATFADGALRDAISLLDQAKMSIAGTISRDDILALAGLTKDDALLALAEALLQANAATVLDLIDQLVMAGRDLARLIPDLAQLFRNLLICQVSDHPEKLVQATAEGLQTMRQLALKATQPQLTAWVRGLSALLGELRWAADTRTVLEIGLIRLMTEGEAPVATPSVAVKPAAVAKPVASAKPVAAKPVPSLAVPAEPATAAVSSPAKPVKPAEPIEPPPMEPEEDVPFPDEAPPLDEPELPGLPRIPQVPPQPVVPVTPPQPIAPVPAVPYPEPVPEPAPVEPQPEAPFADPFAPPAPLVNQQSDAELWQKVLGHLSENGQMTLFLFGRTARVQKLDGSVLQIIFAQSEKIHCDEFRTSAAQKILRDAVNAVTGQVFEIQVVLEGCTEQPGGQGQAPHATSNDTQPEWITKLQTTADQFGIPMTVED